MKVAETYSYVIVEYTLAKLNSRLEVYWSIGEALISAITWSKSVLLSEAALNAWHHKMKI